MSKILTFENGTEIKALEADTFFKRLVGYMFRSNPHCQALIIKPCNSIHTFFMKFNIDVLFLNKDMIVLRKIENLGRGKVIKPINNVTTVVEGECGMFASINEGEKILIK